MLLQVHEIAQAVRAASRMIPGATCLTQALAGRILLSRAGYDSELRIGVCRHAERGFEAHAHRIEGQLLLVGPAPEPEAAERCFRRAMTLARGQGARLSELRAALQLGGLWRDQGRRAQAYDLVAPLYTWFNEGRDTADLREAATLLGQLA